MKTKRFVLGVAVALFTSTAAFQAQACGVSFGFSLPFLSFGIGLGIGAPCAWPAYRCGYPYPAYAYAHPAYAYNQPINDIPPVAAASPAPAVAETPPWVPSTPGAGHWVPDPEPYAYAPVAVAKKTPASTAVLTQNKVTVTKSPEGVPVYILTQSPKPES